MKRGFVYFVLMLILPSVAGWSQQAQASGSSITLPDMTEEVRPLENQAPAVPTPDLPPLPLPAPVPPLPKEKDLTIPEGALKTTATLDTQSRADLGETFNEIRLGAGLWDGVSASLSLYRPGADPAFSLGFSHDSMDGFAFHTPGEGYTARATSLTGRLRGGTKTAASWSLQGAFSDESTGLQGKSPDFYAASHQYLSLLGNYKVPLGPLSLTSTLEGHNAFLSLDRSRSATAIDSASREMYLTPTVALGWATDIISLELRGHFGFAGLWGDTGAFSSSDTSKQNGGVDVVGTYEASPALSLGSSLGALWSSAVPLLIPFSLWVNAALGDGAAVQIKGGLESQTVTLESLWRSNPFTDLGPLVADEDRWFTRMTLDLFPKPDTTVRLAADWATSYQDSGRVTFFQNASTASRNLYSYGIQTFTTLGSTVSLRQRIKLVNLSVTWDSQWLDPPVVGKRQRISGEIEYREQMEKYGAALSVALPFDEGGIDVPVINLNGFGRVSSGIRVIGELGDLAMAAKGTEGRSLWGPYVGTGFTATLKVQFSL